MSRDEESDLNDEERVNSFLSFSPTNPHSVQFLYSCIMGINSMLAKEAEARLTIPAMAEKVRERKRGRGGRGRWKGNYT